MQNHSFDIELIRVNWADSFYEGEEYDQFLSFCGNIEVFIREKEKERTVEIFEILTSYMSNHKEIAFHTKRGYFYITVKTSDEIPKKYKENRRELMRFLHERKRQLDFIDYGTRYYDVIFDGKTYYCYREALESIKAKLRELLKGESKWTI